MFWSFRVKPDSDPINIFPSAMGEAQVIIWKVDPKQRKERGKNE